MNTRNEHIYEFGGFRLDTANHLLLREGRPIPLKPKAFDMLLLLLENRSRVLGKDELMELLWPGTFVEEANLSQNIYELWHRNGSEALRPQLWKGARIASHTRPGDSDRPRYF